MNIAGFQPLSLLDYPGVIASIVFTQGCVFRCAYCHNPALISHTSETPLIPQEEIFAQLRKNKRMVEGVCITGGEPTIQAGLEEFIQRLKREQFLVKLDTNGFHPTLVKRLIEKKLVDYIAMDLKHTWDHYTNVTRVGGAQVTANCRKTFELIQQSGVPHEFRTTICPEFHTEEEVIQIATQLAPGSRYALQPIRYGVTLDPDLVATPSTVPLNVHKIVKALHEQRPDLEVITRE